MRGSRRQGSWKCGGGVMRPESVRSPCDLLDRCRGVTWGFTWGVIDPVLQKGEGSKQPLVG